MLDFGRITGFEWDLGNAGKNFYLHGVEDVEAEQVFLDPQLVLLEDIDHSQDEPRFNVLGVIPSGRFLHVTFTLRYSNTVIRVISARDMETSEEIRYVQEGT